MACLALATPRAQAADAVAPVSVPADPAPESANVEERAAAAFNRALQQHAAGDLEGARTSMLESYRLSNRAELLYNIGKIQSALGECALALAAYRDYLKQVPDGRYRAEALGASTELERQCPSADASTVAGAAPDASTMLASPPIESAAIGDQQQPAGADAAIRPPQQDTVAPASNRTATVRWIGWSAIAAGALAGGGAIYFTVKAIDARDRLQDSFDQAWRAKDPALVQVHLQDEQHAHQRWAKILGATGGVLVVGGTVALLFGPKSAAVTAAHVDLHVLPGSLGASYAGTF